MELLDEVKELLAKTELSQLDKNVTITMLTYPGVDSEKALLDFKREISNHPLSGDFEILTLAHNIAKRYGFIDARCYH